MAIDTDRDPWWMWAVIVGLAPLLMAIGLAVAAWEWIFNDNER